MRHKRILSNYALLERADKRALTIPRCADCYEASERWTGGPIEDRHCSCQAFYDAEQWDMGAPNGDRSVRLPVNDDSAAVSKAIRALRRQ